MAAGSDGQVPTEQEGQTPEHLLLAQAALCPEQLADALGQMLVKGPLRQIVDTQTAPRTGRRVDGVAPESVQLGQEIAATLRIVT